MAPRVTYLGAEPWPCVDEDGELVLTEGHRYEVAEDGRRHEVTVVDERRIVTVDRSPDLRLRLALALAGLATFVAYRRWR